MHDTHIDNAKEELKRADHSIYISLKYTRTVDIIKSVVTRLINASDYAILHLLHHLKTKKRIPDIPHGFRPRAALVAQKYVQFKPFITFYYLLRDIHKASFDKKEEYKKNVALIATIGAQRIDVDIEKLKQYYMTVYDFVNAANELAAP